MASWFTQSHAQAFIDALAPAQFERANTCVDALLLHWRHRAITMGPTPAFEVVAKLERLLNEHGYTVIGEGERV